MQDAARAEASEACSASDHDDCVVAVMATSGSTGAPKFVAIGDRALRHRLAWQRATYPLAASSIVALRVRPTFVDCLWELLAPAVFGAGTRLC